MCENNVDNISEERVIFNNYWAKFMEAQEGSAKINNESL